MRLDDVPIELFCFTIGTDRDITDADWEFFMEIWEEVYGD